MICDVDLTDGQSRLLIEKGIEPTDKGEWENDNEL
jgi:hypothetical protein